MWWGHRRSLVDLVQRDLERDPRDAPAIDVWDACARQDLAWIAEAMKAGEAVGSDSPARLRSRTW